MIKAVGICIALLLTLYSWGFVDTNAPFKSLEILHAFVYDMRVSSSVLYGGLITIMFAGYLYVMNEARHKRIGPSNFFKFLGICVAILFFSFPAFSNDIFNYIATAKVTYLYGENPYIVMPIEIANEPMLTFMHAANKTALYGPVWVLLTVVPHILGFGNLLLALYAFKAFIVVFYILIVRLIWHMTKRLDAVIFFALNPLVVIETLVSGHNDVVMMFFALYSFFLLMHKRVGWAIVFLALSILVKGATVLLIPVFIYTWWYRRSATLEWERIWTFASYSMLLIFFLSPLREELYSWYFIWPLTFIALRRKTDVLTTLSFGFTFGLPLRFLPFTLYRDWGGAAPLMKKIVTVIPPVIAGLFYASRKNR